MSAMATAEICGIKEITDMYRKNAWKALKEGEMAQLEAFADKY